MDLPHTTQMLTSRKIKVLHLESTDVCQASCPQCARETDPTFSKSQRHNLTVEQLSGLLSEVFVKRLDKMFMCGNYGDPAANHQTLEIYQWFRHLNPNIVLGMNTNGGLQNTAWWSAISQIMNQPRDYVVFSIDGLEDTNNKYRIGVDWKKLMQNAQAFIDVGGAAHWDMLVYQHNEHQVDACEQLARDMGFRWFQAKVTKRPLVGNLSAPVSWISPVHKAETIDCHALREQSIYIDAQARIHPCCWLGSRQRNFVDDFEEIKASWTGPTPNATCIKACGTKDNVSNFNQQWQRKVQLC
jgi:sulfatase maturation enzyme AslB (radical SAM superfamily)